jgi:hypothetical protein
LRVGKIGPPDGEILAELGKIPLCLSLRDALKDFTEQWRSWREEGVRGSEE